MRVSSGWTSTADGSELDHVSPGSPSRSDLWMKLDGSFSTGSDGGGADMPKSGALPKEDLVAIYEWIQGGAPE